MKKMKIVKRLKMWKSLQETLEQIRECPTEVFSDQIESSFGKLCINLELRIDKYFSKLVHDYCGWLDYYRFDCKMGTCSRTVIIDKQTIELDSLIKLAEILKIDEKLLEKDRLEEEEEGLYVEANPNNLNLNSKLDKLVNHINSYGGRS